MEKKETSLIRKANAKDINAILEIEKKCFPGPTAYPKPQLAYLILKANSTCLIESDSEALRGFIIVLYRKGTSIGCIETIAVEPSSQNRGVGARLLEAAEADMKSRGLRFAQLEVSEGNESAIGLYRKTGYILKARLVGFYQFEHNETCDAVRMIKTLDGAQ